jgi:hypothetical protein
MNVLTNGAVTLYNGLVTTLDGVVSPLPLIVGLLVLSFSWLALIELDELDRQGRKPEIGRGR